MHRDTDGNSLNRRAVRRNLKPTKVLTFNKRYFLIAAVIFTAEVVMALFIHDNFIRPYFGDFLVVILIYCFIRTILKAPVLTVALFVLLFSFTIESLQYFQIVEKIGLENSKIAKVILGTSFAWKDIITYVVGFITILIVESTRTKRKIKGSV